MRYKILILVLATFFLAFSSVVSEAAVPHLLRYQGTLTDANNVPLEGSYNLTFRIYDATTAGNLLWSETQSAVSISNGVFSVLLGSVTALNLAFDKDYWLSTEVGTSGEMSPRQRITSVGYAIRAEKAEGLTGAQDISTSNLIKNGSLESWKNGASSAPDSWTLAGTGATISRDATNKRKDNYAATVTYGSALALLSFDHPDHLYFASKKISFSCWVKTSVSNQARIEINDGIASTHSSYHTGSGNWELLTTTATINAAPTDLLFRLNIAQTGTASFDCAMALEGDTSFAFSSNPADEHDYKVGLFTRDLSIASGTQSITGLGFKPKAVSFLAYNHPAKSEGFDDGVTQKCMGIATDGTTGISKGDHSIYCTNAGETISQMGKVESFDADGFTIRWLKTGSPSGTFIIIYKAFK